MNFSANFPNSHCVKLNILTLFSFKIRLYPEITVDNFCCVISFIDVPIIIGMDVC